MIYDPVGGEVLEKSMRAAAYVAWQEWLFGPARLWRRGFGGLGHGRMMASGILIRHSFRPSFAA